MNYEEKLALFAKNNNLSFLKQEFNNAFNGGWFINTYSIYNSSGCFTIYHLLQRNEIDFFTSNKISNDIKELTKSGINVFNYHPEIWKSKTKKYSIFKFLFYDNIEKVVSTLVEVMELESKEKNSVFGIKLETV